MRELDVIIEDVAGDPRPPVGSFKTSIVTHRDPSLWVGISIGFDATQATQRGDLAHNHSRYPHNHSRMPFTNLIAAISVFFLSADTNITTIVKHDLPFALFETPNRIVGCDDSASGIAHRA